MRALVAAICIVLTASIATARAQTRIGPSLEDLFALRDIGTLEGGLALSPDGHWLAVMQSEADLERNEVRYALLLNPVAPGPAPRILADAGAGLPQYLPGGRANGGLRQRFVRWAPDSRRLAYIAERERRAELWIADIRGRAHLAARPDGDVTDFAWLSDQTMVLSTATPRAALVAQGYREARDGFRVDETFEPSFSSLPYPSVDADARMLHLDLRSGALRPASEDEAVALRAPPRGSVWIAPRDPHSTVARPPRALFAARDGGTLMCEHASCAGRLREAGDLANGDIWFSRTEGHADGDYGLYVWTPRSQDVRRVRLAAERLYGCRSHADVVYCLQEFSAQPRRIVSIDTRNSDLAVVYDPNPEWGRFALPRIERLQFEDERGLQSYADLVYPLDYVAGHTYPTIIVQYRSHGFLRAGVGGEYPIFPAAARGYAVLSIERPEPRLREQQISLTELDREMLIGDWEERMKLNSLDGLIDLAVATGVVDRRRIAITGMSDGAETVYWALRDRQFAAAVTSGPPIEPNFWGLTSSEFRRDRAGAGITDPTVTPDAWWRHNAAIYFADRIQTPILMNLSQSEMLQAMPLYAQLEASDTPVEAYVYPDAHHVKSRPSQVLAAQRRAMAWIDFWVRDDFTPDPADPGREARWSIMRRRSTDGAAVRAPH